MKRQARTGGGETSTNEMSNKRDRDQLPNFRGLVQNENVGCLVEELLRQRGIKQSMGVLFRVGTHMATSITLL